MNRPPRPPDVVIRFGRAAIGHRRSDPMHRKEPTAVEPSDDVAKVEKDGVYTLPDGTPVRLKEGDVLPDGAEFRGDAEWTQENDPYGDSPRDMERQRIAEASAGEADAGEAPATRARAAAPENKARTTVAPETKDTE